MVKKRSHEERHEESMPMNETDENQTTAETETSGQTTPPGDAESAVKSQAEEELLGKLTEMQDRYSVFLPSLTITGRGHFAKR